MSRVVSCVFLLALCVTWARPAQAQADESRKFLICHTASVSSAEEAQPYIDGFGSYLAGKLGWETGSFAVKFENKRTAGAASLAEWKPSFATLALGLYLEHRISHKLKPLVLARVNGKTTNRYRILTKKGFAGTLDELKGKKLQGNLLDDPVYLSRVVFDGKLDVASFFKLKQSKRPLRAIQKVAKGRADAVLVDDLQYDMLKELHCFADLEVVFESQEVPNLGMVFVEGRALSGDVDKFVEALVNMCKDPEGKKMCETFAVEGFERVPAGALGPIEKKYDK